MPYYAIQLAPAPGSDKGLVVTAKLFPEFEAMAADQEEALRLAREGLKEALAKRRAVGDPLPEPLAERPADGAFVEVLDDWVHDPGEPDPGDDLRLADDKD